MTNDRIWTTKGPSNRLRLVASWLHVSDHWSRWLWFCGIFFLLSISSQVIAATWKLSEAHARIYTAEEGHQQRIIHLPFAWDTHFPGQSGQVELTFQWTRDSTVVEPLALYLPKIGNRYAAVINGHVLVDQLSANATEGERKRLERINTDKRPQLLPLPSILLDAHNVLTIRLEADLLRKAGLKEVWVGPSDELSKWYEHAYMWQVGWTMVVIAVSLSVGLFSFILWRAQGLSGDQGHIY